MQRQIGSLKDWWDIIDIVGIPVVLALIGYFANRHLSKINMRLGNAERDTNVAEQFSRLYFNNQSRRLSPHFVSLIDNKETRKELRTFMIWDVLEKHIHAAQPFKFDSELSDCHLLGEAVQAKAGEEGAPAIEAWREIKTVCFRCWTNHEEELKQLFRWIDETYKIREPRH